MQQGRGPGLLLGGVAIVAFLLGAGVVAGVFLLRDDPDVVAGGDGGAPSASAKPLPPSAPRPAGRPGPDNTGVPADVTLRPSDIVDVTAPGTVLDGLDLGCLRIKADDVTVKRSRIRCDADDLPAVRADDGVDRLLLEDTEIDGMGVTSIGIGFARFTLRRVNVHNTVDGVRAGDSSVIEDSWIHSLARKPGTHNDGIQSIRGNGIVIRRNTIDVFTDGDFMNAAYIISAGSERSVTDVRVEDNYLNGGNYTVYLGDSDAKSVSGVVFRHNVFGGDFRYGPRVAIPEGTVWEGNRLASGAEVPGKTGKG
ncbi:right-handed parallel beta-helix repeat-containing protein [Motilibacter aurantiacus]|uniref:hypothetical protein n=1 Tax=Motilibacter aurantiacus TaxID=2714955 RepID=UPI00140BD4A1|nr:hypothetical protein [Motilibacter aurantiacus]NHC45878.1 hypothetical protein [Motilibacter aurantiacus]